MLFIYGVEGLGARPSRAEVGYARGMRRGGPIEYAEPVFRPPSEAASLILQLTVGCSWNRCTFCAMYREKEYRVRLAEQIVGEIRAVAEQSDPRRVFLADGDALAAPLELIEQVLGAIREYLPQVQRVGIYGDSRAILAKGEEGLRRLGDAGLGIVYFGVESGDDVTLRAIRKGALAARQLEACRLVLRAGLKLSVMVLLGLAGKEGSARHAEATGSFLAAAQPSYAAALTLTPIPGTPLHDEWRAGRFELPDRWGDAGGAARNPRGDGGLSRPVPRQSRLRLSADAATDAEGPGAGPRVAGRCPAPS